MLLGGDAATDVDACLGGVCSSEVSLQMMWARPSSVVLPHVGDGSHRYTTHTSIHLHSKYGDPNGLAKETYVHILIHYQ